jgi:hypothetical protein
MIDDAEWSVSNGKMVEKFSECGKKVDRNVVGER